MPLPANIQTACPDCGTKILVPLLMQATDQWHRKCRRCKQRWSILVKPRSVATSGEVAVHEATFFRMPAQTAYALHGIAGLVQQTKARVNGAIVGVYNASQAGLDDDNGESPWATVCEVHNNVCAHRTMQLARHHAADPTGWCEACSFDNRAED